MSLISDSITAVVEAATGVDVLEKEDLRPIRLAITEYADCFDDWIKKIESIDCADSLIIENTNLVDEEVKLVISDLEGFKKKCWSVASQIQLDSWDQRQKELKMLLKKLKVIRQEKQKLADEYYSQYYSLDPADYRKEMYFEMSNDAVKECSIFDKYISLVESEISG